MAFNNVTNISQVSLYLADALAAFKKHLSAQSDEPNAFSSSFASLNNTVISWSSRHSTGDSSLTSYSYLTLFLKCKRSHVAQAPKSALVIAVCSDCTRLTYKSRWMKASAKGINVTVTLKTLHTTFSPFRVWMGTQSTKTITTLKNHRTICRKCTITNGTSASQSSGVKSGTFIFTYKERLISADGGC